MMDRMIWIGLAFVFLLPAGCIDIGDVPERECLAEKRCVMQEGPVCGADGTTYECESQARCLGVQVDSSGDACRSQSQCEPVTCELYCENGFETNEDGCEICACRDEAGLCGDDPCVAEYCESRQAECMRESERATMGACGWTDYVFYEPEPECVCTDDGCDRRGCGADRHCQSANALCVSGIDAEEGYCVKASCDDLIEAYEDVIAQRTDCTSDSDCSQHYPIHRCCASLAINSAGKTELESIDRFASMTSCGQQWDERCAEFDCGPPAAAAPSCVEGTCLLTD